jgi:hypothetical protein
MREEMTPGTPARARLWRPELAWLPVVLVVVLLIYLIGLDNALVFDDGYLTDGLFRDYGVVFAVRPRMLSYGSFIWLQSLWGEGWWKQRLVNLAIHVGVVLAMWALYREILRAIAAPAPAAGEEAQAPYDRSLALGIAVGFFALNPVAVYAVAYLVQRSILLATFFVVLGLWFFARAIARRKWPLYLAALACYVLAVASKEHAILAPIAALPVYVVVGRPRPRQLLAAVAAGVLLVALAAGLLAYRYGSILGKPFDEYSHVYLAQLAALDPGAARHAFALSIMNEAWLFFRYGVEWVLPWSGWMSIDLRPPFPLSWTTFPQILGPLAYVATLAGGAWLVLRYRDLRALIGLSLLMPAVLFATEFTTVWVQDPFVLYRSYLWAIGVPGLVFVAVHGPSPRALIGVGLVVGGLLTWQAMDRVLSLTSPESAWTDAIHKLPNDPRSVGRWFPFLNRGTAYVDTNDFTLALRDFEASSALGDLGMGAFNTGSVLSAQGKQREALAAFDRAEREGYTLYNLPFQRGLALAALHRPQEALDQFLAARKLNPPSPTLELLLLNTGRTAIQLNRRDEAVDALQYLVVIEPRNHEASYLLGMAYIMKGDARSAWQVLNKLIAEDPNGRAYYARALANYSLKRKAEALSDIDNAIRIGPDNANLRAWRDKILAMP